MKKTLLNFSLFFAAICIMQAQPILKPYQGTIPGGVTKALPIINNTQTKTAGIYDVSYTAFDTVTNYIITPISQVQPLNFAGTIKNTGGNTVMNVQMTVDVKNAALTTVYSGTSTAATQMDSNDVFNATVPSYTPTAPDFYTLRFGTSMDETDADSTNSVFGAGLFISDTVYARDNGNVTSALGIGAGNGGYLGQDFEIFSPVEATSVSFFVTKGYTNKKAAAVIWDMSNGKPNNIIAGTDTMLYPDDSARFYTIPLTQKLTLNAGKYAVTMIEFDSTIQIGTTPNLFILKSTWINWPTSPAGGWANNEFFGAAFKICYVVRLNINEITAIHNETKNTATHLYPNPANDVLFVSLTGSNAGRFEIIDNKGSVVYSEYVNNAQNHRIDIANLSNGIYMLRTITTEGTSTNKFIKNN